MTSKNAARQPDTRERILEEALPLFAQHGYAGTSTRMIAKAAGVNVATLAYYFQGKEGLYFAVLERLYTDMMRFIPTTMPPLGPNTARWLATQLWSFARDHRTHIRLALRHFLDKGNHADVVVNEWTQPILERVQGLVLGLRPEWTPVRARLFIFSAMHMVVRFAVEQPQQMATMMSMGSVRDIDEEVIGFLEEYIQTMVPTPTA